MLMSSSTGKEKEAPLAMSRSGHPSKRDEIEIKLTRKSKKTLMVTIKKLVEVLMTPCT